MLLVRYAKILAIMRLLPFHGKNQAIRENEFGTLHGKNAINIFKINNPQPFEWLRVKFSGNFLFPPEGFIAIMDEQSLYS